MKRISSQAFFFLVSVSVHAASVIPKLPAGELLEAIQNAEKADYEAIRHAEINARRELKIPEHEILWEIDAMPEATRSWLYMSLSEESLIDLTKNINRKTGEPLL